MNNTQNAEQYEADEMPVGQIEAVLPMEENEENETAGEDKKQRGFLESLPGKPNILNELDETQLNELQTKVNDEYAIDLNSRSEWSRMMKSAMELAMQVKKEKTFPWPKAANVKFPLLTNAAIQFNARAYPAIVPGKDIVKCKVNGDDSGVYETQMGEDGQPAINPETGEPDAKEIVPPGFKQARADRVAHHMSWQLGDEMEEWEADTDRLLMILPIIGVCFRKTYFDPLKGRNCSLIVSGGDLVVNYKAKSLEDAPRISEPFTLYPYQITERINDGIYDDFDYMRKSEDQDAPQEFIEQHRLFDLDGDGYPEPYVVIFHKETQKVVRMVARFEPEDIERNKRTGKIRKIKPTHYYTKYGFVPNPESAIYDLGFGVLLQPINDTVNTIFNQMLDAGTIQNAGGGFFGKGLKMKSGTMSFRPGEYKPVDVAGGKIRENVYTMEHKGASPTMFQLLGLLIEAGKEISSVKDILSGESQGANASPTTTVALIEQGLKTFTAIFKRVHRSLKAELKKLYMLNRLYLDEEVYFTLHDDQEAVKDKDYAANDYDVTPVSDPTVVTDMQKMSKAQMLIGFKDDPFFNPMEVRRRFLDAVGFEDIDKLLQEPQPQGPEMKDQIKSMELELETLIQKQKLPAEIAELFSRSIKNIADAEAKEAGTQLQAYKTIIDSLTMGAQNNEQVSSNTTTAI